MKKRKKTTYSRRLWITLAAAAVLMVALAAGSAAAKYLRTSEKKVNPVTTHIFYFTSNLLAENGENCPDIYLNAGTTAIDIELRNYEDELRWANIDVGYKVTVQKWNDSTSTWETASLVSGTPSLTGTLTGNVKTSDKISLTGLSAGRYKVTAVGSNGYVKTLSAFFQILPSDAAVYKYLDTSDTACVVLTVWTSNITGNCTIAYSGSAPLVPDTTESVMSGWTTETSPWTDSTSFTSYPYASKTYRFLGDHSGVTVGNFEVQIGSETAAPSNLN